MKTMLDQSNPLFTSDYAFRDVYFLSAAEDGEGMDSRAISGLGGLIECFEKAYLAGMAFGGADAVGTIQGNPALREAYEMGKEV